jgi:glycerol-3-phosphate acyltransferase PlsX
VDLGTVRTVSDGPIRVAVDAMGGDHAPLEIVTGTLSWARAHPADRVLLVGIPERIAEVAGGPIPPNVEIVPASQVVEMEESPAQALKSKKDSSILVAMDLIKQGRADALVTAGHSGADMAAAVLKLGRLPGVDRPALAVQMVTETGPFVLLDIGANMDSSGNNLYQFAHMGSLYAERVLGVPNPRIALLSIGEEKGKGDQAVQQATELLDEDGTLNFVGNVEGRDLVKHMADVAVCDAMVGNVTMKFFEGLATFIFKLWEKEFRGSIRGKLAYLLMRPSIGRIRTTFDYEKMGASPLLGVKGMVLITHGSAKRRMVEFALDAGAAAGRANIPDLIADAFRGKSRHG